MTHAAGLTDQGIYFDQFRESQVLRVIEVDGYPHPLPAGELGVVVKVDDGLRLLFCSGQYLYIGASEFPYPFEILGSYNHPGFFAELRMMFANDLQLTSMAAAGFVEIESTYG